MEALNREKLLIAARDDSEAAEKLVNLARNRLREIPDFVRNLASNPKSDISRANIDWVIQCANTIGLERTASACEILRTAMKSNNHNSALLAARMVEQTVAELDSELERTPVKKAA